MVQRLASSPRWRTSPSTSASSRETSSWPARLSLSKALRRCRPLRARISFGCRANSSSRPAQARKGVALSHQLHFNHQPLPSSKRSGFSSLIPSSDFRISVAHHRFRQPQFHCAREFQQNRLRNGNLIASRTYRLTIRSFAPPEIGVQPNAAERRALRNLRAISLRAPTLGVPSIRRSRGRSVSRGLSTAIIARRA